MRKGRPQGSYRESRKSSTATALVADLQEPGPDGNAEDRRWTYRTTGLIEHVTSARLMSTARA